MIKKIIPGSPGTGKTTRLIKKLEEHLENGTDPKKICFLSFTKKAASEAKERALKKFTDITSNDLIYFRTIHSFAYYQMNVSRSRVMTKEHYLELGGLLGLQLSGSTNAQDDELYGMNTDDRYLFIENLSRITYRPLKEIWEELADEELSWWTLEKVSRGLKNYKENRLLMDFTDMLVNYLHQGVFPEFDVVFVDEAQDLSPVQWDIVKKLISKAKVASYVAGDDDQAIYKWAGADVDSFINLDGEVEALKKSYRIPKSVHRVAMDIVNRISNRRPKEFESKEEEGSVEYVYNLESIDMSKGEWLLLARNGYLLKEFENHCTRSGYVFDSVFRSPLKSPALKAIKAWEAVRRGSPITDADMEYIKKYTRRDPFAVTRDQLPIWHEGLEKISYREREYFIAALRNKESLVKTPRIKISTIHGVKGGECTNVVVLSDISFRTFNEMNRDEDNEHRVFYVAVTRTIENLFIIMPSTNMCYDI